MKYSVIFSLALSTFSSDISAQSWCANEKHQHWLEGNTVKLSNLSSTLQFNEVDSGPVTHDALLYVQRTYFAKYGLYEGTQRILKMVENHNAIYEEQGVDANFQIANIVEVRNVPDYLAFSNSDDNSSAIVLSDVALNPGKWEYDVYEKWQADHVGYVRELNDIDGFRRGVGSTGSGFFAWVDSGDVDYSSLVMSHEIGHNLRATHEIEDSPDYIIADAHAAECGGSKTIMWSDSSEQYTIPYYSNPDKKVEGEACGDISEANNLRVIKEGVVEASTWGAGVEGAGDVAFTESSYTVKEDGELVVFLTRTGSLDEEASVRIYVTNDSALYGEDFFDVYKEVAFEVGADTTSATFEIINDTNTEKDEQFNLTLMFPYRLNIGNQATVPVTIQDSGLTGFSGNFTVSTESVVEGVGTNITIKRDGGSTGEVAIRIFTENVEARSSADYDLVHQVLLFRDGDTIKTIAVDTIDDVEVEPTENVAVNIESKADAGFVSIVEPVAYLEIHDEDSVTMGDVDYGEMDPITVTEGDTFEVNLARSGGFLGKIKGNVLLTIGSTVTETAYEFEDGQSELVVEVEVPDNNSDEPNYNGEVSVEVETSDATATEETFEVHILDNDAASVQTDVADSSSGGGGSIGAGLIGLLLLGLRRKFL